MERMKKTLIVGFTAMFFLVQALQGVIPQKWEHRRLEDFLKGKFDGISVSFDGILSLSPKEDKIEGPGEEFYLSLLLTEKEVAYLGTGHGGKIYRIDKDGKVELYCKIPEMDIYCLAQDRKGDLYAGTSPNGKIYKITAKGERAVFFNPQEKYIWDLLFTEKGFLLAAVGEKGGIYKINSQGEGRLILKAEENHILCLKNDRNGDLIAGSGGKGALYRIKPGKKVSILFESPFEEIKSVAIDRAGNIYAAAGGSVTRPRKEEVIPVSTKEDTDITITVTPSSVQSKRVTSTNQKQPGALYRVNPDGIAKRIWYSNEELIYTLLWNEREKKIIFGTGNKGRIYTIDKNEKISLLLQKNSEQVYLLLPSNSKIYTLSNNPSSMSLLFPERRFKGEYFSQVLDAKVISSWGRIKWQAELPTGSRLQFQTRSGNTDKVDKTWSEWSPPYKNIQGEQILSPKARYVQYKAIFQIQSGNISPYLHEVSLFYLQTNLAPEITKLDLLPSNEVYLKPPEQGEIIWGMNSDLSEQAKSKDKTLSYIVAKKAKRKGFQTIIWAAADENGDNLLYSIYIKKEDENKWRVFRERWADKIFAFDTLSFPDGIYYVKVVASDAPSNPLGMELEADKISRPMIIDNSLPVIKNFRAAKDRNKLNITFLAEDSMTYIKEVKFLIRPNEWQNIFPEDGICDSKQEKFNVTVTLSPNSDNLIAVKVLDSHGNVGVYRTTF